MEEWCRELLAELGISGADEFVSAKPLTGGVASDIALVELRDRRLCVKFALPKLKVEAAPFRFPRLS